MPDRETAAIEPKPDAHAAPPGPSGPTGPSEDRASETDRAAGGAPGAGGFTVEALVEAALMTIDKPLPASRLAEALSSAGLGWSIEPSDVDEAVAALNASYADAERAMRIESTAGGYRVMTLPAAAGVIAAVAGARPSPRLSKAALETLAIIAYRQPITRAELEAIRGVGCGEVLRSLIERKLAAITGRAEELGRPMLYGTTKTFLETFGLASLKDLPPMQDRLAAALPDEGPAAEAGDGNRSSGSTGHSDSGDDAEDGSVDHGDDQPDDQPDEPDGQADGTPPRAESPADGGPGAH